jgi:hypothetical protein
MAQGRKYAPHLGMYALNRGQPATCELVATDSIFLAVAF